MRHNAWVAELDHLAELIDVAFHRKHGEVWLFDNDLAAFERVDIFEKIYRQRVDGAWSNRIHTVKLLLRRPILEKMLSNKEIAKNLASLRDNRIRTFQVGCIDDVTPSLSAEMRNQLMSPVGDCHPWIIYTANEAEIFDNSVVILRPPAYPFYDSARPLRQTAVAWSTDEAGLRLLSHNSYDWFRKAFHENAEINFRSLLPRREPDGTLSIELDDKYVRGAADQLARTLAPSLGGVHLPPVDVAILATTDAEYSAAIDIFGLVEMEDYAHGWLDRGGVDPLSIICVKSAKQGSVNAAITTSSLIARWRPKALFLVGICGAFEEDEAPRPKGPPSATPLISSVKPKTFKYKKVSDQYFGDVFIGAEVLAYEYQKLTYDPSAGKFLESQESRHFKPNAALLERASLFARAWRYEGELHPQYRKYGAPEARTPKARSMVFACGSKVVAAGFPWLKQVRIAMGNRKAGAVEMEAEGVAAAIEEFGQKDVPLYLVVKSISDFASYEKSDDFHEFASRTSAAFVRDFVKSPPFAALIEPKT